MTSVSTYQLTTNTPKFGGRSRYTHRPTIKNSFRESYLQWLSREFPEIIIEYYNNLSMNKPQCFCNDGLGNITCEDCEYLDSESETELESEPEPEPELETQARRVRSMAPSPEPVPESQPEVSYNYTYNYVERMEDTGEYWYEVREEWS